jgi:hypothetical protein
MVLETDIRDRVVPVIPLIANALESVGVHPVASESSQPGVMFRRANDQCPSVTGCQVLERVKGKRLDISLAPDSLALVGSAAGVGAVLDYRDPRTAGQSIELIQITGITGIMHKHHGPRSLGDAFRNGLNVQVPCLRLDIGENRFALLIEDNVVGGDEGKRSRDYL